MWVDPVRHPPSRDREVTVSRKVIRGVGCLEPAVKNVPNPVDRAWDYVHEEHTDVGLRLAMTVPCNVARVVVQ